MNEPTPAVADRGETDAPSDEELMALVAAGRHEALGVLHQRYAGRVFGLAVQTLERGAAEELVQDVFLAVWSKVHTFDPARGTFRAWVLRIAHLRVLNELRRQRRRPAMAGDGAGDAANLVPDPGPGPAEAAWRENRRALVQSAVNDLPPPQRQALGLAFHENLSHQQVAAFLNVPLGTAKSRIRAGLITLRGRLAPLLAAGLILLACAVVVMRRDVAQRSALNQYDRALDLVISSDVAPRRLTAAPGVAREVHGTYRGRAGTAQAVMSFSHFAPAPEGQAYHAWARYGERWLFLGEVHPDARGHDRLIAESPALAALPEALMVTLEPAGNRAAPRGTAVVQWPGAE